MSWIHKKISKIDKSAPVTLPLLARYFGSEKRVVLPFPFDGDSDDLRVGGHLKQYRLRAVHILKYLNEVGKSLPWFAHGYISDTCTTAGSGSKVSNIQKSICVVSTNRRPDLAGIFTC